MTFVHDDPEFAQLLAIVARDTGIAIALIEKDYWITHSLWALHDLGLELWFKGGTSLSKGFHLIQRFSEDLDLMVQHGTVEGLPPVSNWTSLNKGPVQKRRAFYDALAPALAIPGVEVHLDPTRQDKHARNADYIGRYPGAFVDHLPPTMSPFVRFEIGAARVVPFIERPLSSFVHDHLERQQLMDDYLDNRPRRVRCVHPCVTLFEKLDALTRRYPREPVEPDSFVRHYEDMAQIVRALDQLPALPMPAITLLQDMLVQRDVAALPHPDEPALALEDALRRAEIERAYQKIAPMFWGARLSLDEACTTIRGWLTTLRKDDRVR